MSTGRVEKLGSKGFFAIEVDGVLGRATRAQSADVDRLAGIKPLIGLGVAVLGHIKERVQGRGVLGEGQTYAGRSSRFVRVSPMYGALAVAAGAATGTPNRIDRYMTIRWSGGVLGSFSVSGGMWKGAQVASRNSGEVRLEFAGVSPGRGKVKRTAIQEPMGSDGRPLRKDAWRHTAAQRYDFRVVPKNTPNRFKATVIEQRAGVHVLTPRSVEGLAISESVTDAVVNGKALAWLRADSPRQSVDFGGDRDLRRRINASW